MAKKGSRLIPSNSTAADDSNYSLNGSTLHKCDAQVIITRIFFGSLDHALRSGKNSFKIIKLHTP